MEPPSPPARPLTRALHSDQVFVARNHLSQGPLNHGLVRTLHVAERTMAALNLMVACAPISRAICDVLPIPASIMVPIRIPRIPQSAGLADPYLVANLQRGHRARLGVDCRTTWRTSLVLGRTLRDTDHYSCHTHSHRSRDCAHCAVQFTWRRCRRLCTRYQSGFSGPCGLTRTFTDLAAKFSKLLHLFSMHIPHRWRKKRVRLACNIKTTYASMLESSPERPSATSDQTSAAAGPHYDFRIAHDCDRYGMPCLSSSESQRRLLQSHSKRRVVAGQCW